MTHASGTATAVIAEEHNYVWHLLCHLISLSIPAPATSSYQGDQGIYAYHSFEV